MKLLFVTQLLAASLASPTELEVPAATSCSPCQTEFCPRSENDCVSGLMPDECGCCHLGVCGLREEEKCLDNDFDGDVLAAGFGKYSRCGENLKCVLRNDLRPEDPLESLCVCKDTRLACGHDNATYESICQMNELGIELNHWGPCKSPPEIISGPEDVNSYVGKRFALDCEVKGFPVPVIYWEFQGFNGLLKTLPGDDTTISVQNRGGPESYMVTSWVQIEYLRQIDSGNYICVAKNSEGTARSMAAVRVLPYAA